jgi:RHS repeat-associated protein
LAELDKDNVVQKYHVWGQDLSQSLQGAGGIGGLLATIDDGDIYLFTFDGNGNVVDVLDDQGAEAAHYEYDPFGRIIEKSGDYKDANKFRFSTKYYEDDLGLSYYGFRYYQADTGRWLSRDPIRESGDINLYRFAGNEPVGRVDIFGLQYQHTFEKYGRMDVTISSEPKLGEGRAIKIEFTLKPAKHCDCDAIDFQQAMGLENLEGDETTYILSGISVGSDKPVERQVGQGYADPEGWYLKERGRGGRKYPNEMDDTTFYAWMEDTPMQAFEHAFLFTFRASDGTEVIRKARLLFLTCAGCLEGWDEGQLYGCVLWKLDYPAGNLAENLAISVASFMEP